MFKKLKKLFKAQREKKMDSDDLYTGGLELFNGFSLDKTIIPLAEIDTAPSALKRGKMLWGTTPLPQSSILLGTVRRGEDAGEEALILMPTGVTVGGNAGDLKPLPPLTLACLRCGYSWSLRGSSMPKKCPSCLSPYWDRPRRITGSQA